jgi:hypothetical protein
LRLFLLSIEFNGEKVGDYRPISYLKYLEDPIPE